MTEEQIQPQSAVDSQPKFQKTRKQKVRKDPNAPFIREKLELPEGHNKLLLHSCCAPCSGEVMEAILASGIEFTIYFYNPNIHPLKEYLIRKEENIRFANPLIDDKKVEEITKICGLYDDIMAMPEKFDTIVGEKGVSLSGGQKQRLAMSRALIINPEILILDDSLSAVDAKTEHIILENLKEQRSGQTNIITAHRLSAVVEADLIIVLGENTIIEKGTHDELIANNGWYKETYESQQMEESLKGGSSDVEK